MIRLLLTSAGITNESIRNALLELVGKPFTESRAICIPTAIYAYPGGTGYAWRLLRELADLGWSEFGVLELTTLPTILEQDWLPAVQAADVIIVGGGNTGYLSYWMFESGFAARLPALLETRVYLSISAGGAMVTHGLNIDRERLEKTGIYYDDEYDEAAPPSAGGDKTIPLVNFVIRPHLNAEYFPSATLENMARAAAKVTVPLYAFDDQTALKVVGDKVEIISEGEWQLFNEEKIK
jgi:dipeptidase E